MRLINLRDIPVGQRNLGPNVVRIDRRSKWGNQFKIGDDHPRYGKIDRALAVALFRDYALQVLASNPDWLEPLRGKTLACWCTPEPCHGDVILEILGERHD